MHECEVKAFRLIAPVSVTRRIKNVKQPRGGYVNPKLFTIINRDDGKSLSEVENLHPSLIGMVVDYLTRCCSGSKSEDAFGISLLGASIMKDTQHAKQLCKQIKGLDDISITSACQMSGYDVCFRVGAMQYKQVRDILPDAATIENVRTMVTRSLTFLEEYGPKTKDHFTFEGGYTPTVTNGDGDFLTESTLWDFKASKTGPTSANTLQVLMYYLMGKQSVHHEFDTIDNIGFFNPRLNNVYLLRVSDIDPDVISAVSCDVIGYN